jgi:hypothetical protein
VRPELERGASKLQSRWNFPLKVASGDKKLSLDAINVDIVFIIFENNHAIAIVFVFYAGCHAFVQFPDFPKGTDFVWGVSHQDVTLFFLKVAQGHENDIADRNPFGSTHSSPYLPHSFDAVGAHTQQASVSQHFSDAGVCLVVAVAGLQSAFLSICPAVDAFGSFFSHLELRGSGRVLRRLSRETTAAQRANASRLHNTATVR